jgi:hypothetical protein
MILPPLPQLELEPWTDAAVARLADDGRAALRDAAAPLRLGDAVKQRRLSPEQGRRIVRRLVADAGSLVRSATEALVAGALRLGPWFGAMRDALLPRHFAAGMAVLNHADPPPADLDAIAAESRRQVGFLGRFRGALARAELYAAAIWATAQSVARRRAMRDGFRFEENVLGISDSCLDCLEQTRRGRVPIGTLLPIGQRLCRVNCKCHYILS